MAEQKAAAREQKEQEMKAQHAKEQENYQNKILLAKSEGDRKKLDLNFMYDLPPGMKKENKEDEGSEAEVKFEWQKGAPKEAYAAKLGLDVHDQPFGICVRNVKCFKCGKWGHQNTDKECPMYGQKRKDSELESLRLSDPLRLIEDMRDEHGIMLKKNVIGREINPMAENQQILESDDEVDPDLAYIESLTVKEKQKLLKKLNRIERNEMSLNSSSSSRKRKRKKSIKRQDPETSSSSGSESSSDMSTSPEIYKHTFKEKKRHSHKKLRNYYGHHRNKTNDSENEWTSDDDKKKSKRHEHGSKNRHKPRKKDKRKKKYK